VNADLPIVVHGSVTPAQAGREAEFRSALEETSHEIRAGRTASDWGSFKDVAVTLSSGRIVHVWAHPNWGFRATMRIDDGIITLTCPIVDSLDGIRDLPERAASHASWAADMLSRPRTKHHDETWVRVATDLAALAAIAGGGSSGTCTLKPGPGDDPIEIECTGPRPWRMSHSRKVVEHVARNCPEYLRVKHSRSKGRHVIAIDHGPEVVCFASAPDVMEGLRLMRSTGLDPADLLRVDDHA
jgi:hypothetical protein